MKVRRKKESKYTVGEHGQITNNQPVLSEKAQTMISLMTMMDALQDLAGVEEEKEITDESVEATTEATDATE